MRERFDLDGKVAIVTGASKEMGEGIALALAEYGADLAVTARDVTGLAKVATAIEALGRKALAIEADLLDFASLPRIVERTVGALGRVDILVNNAGGGPWSNYGWALRMTEEMWDAMFGLNVKAPMFLAQAAALAMKETGGGRIINLSSGAGSHASPRMSNYGAAKAALENLSQSLAQEWGQFGIRVNVVVPGLVDTTNARQSTFATPGRAEQFVKSIPLGRIGVPEDIASAVLYLASPAAEWVTGATILVNGGGGNLRSFG